MLRKIIKPNSENYMIQIPKEYINKKVEILILPFIYEENINTTKKFNPEFFYNVSNSPKNSIDDYLKDIKEEWEQLI